MARKFIGWEPRCLRMILHLLDDELLDLETLDAHQRTYNFDNIHCTLAIQREAVIRYLRRCRADIESELGVNAEETRR